MKQSLFLMLALLVGSIGVFVILAVAMYASQKIKW